MQDPELFELCKEVYERTGWTTKPKFPCYVDNATSAHAQPGYPKRISKLGMKTDWEFGKQYGLYVMYPLYTSDYILPKLYDYIGRFLLIPQSGNRWALFPDNIEVIYSDTPLKALLKLVIALHKSNNLTTKEAS